jgi:hypothetical protein
MESEISEQSHLQDLLYIVLQMQVCVTTSWFFHGISFFYLFLTSGSLTQKTLRPCCPHTNAFMEMLHWKEAHAT